MIDCITKANQSFREKQYYESLEWLEAAERIHPELKELTKLTRNLVSKRLQLPANPISINSCAFQLEPVNELVLSSHEVLQWESLGNDPWFFLQSEASVCLDAGWYIFSILVESTRSGGTAKIYFDHGSGFSESSCLVLPYKSRQMLTRVIELKEPVTTLRLDPMESKGRFSVSCLNGTKISEREASRRMLARIALAKDNFSLAAFADVQASIQATAFSTAVPFIDCLKSEYEKVFVSGVNTATYEDWIDDFETPITLDKQSVNGNLESFKWKPLISILVPTYESKSESLRECIDSVLNQSYPNWELCIADDASKSPHVRSILESYKKIDSRIKVAYRKTNGNISASTNTALELAKGDFVALLDHDDKLAEHALFYVVEAIQGVPDANLIYTDEDKIDANGKRFDPHFKSDWNLDLLFSQNYISHLTVCRTAIIQRIGGFRLGVEGSQDHDMLLRLTKEIPSHSIIHVPRVLYHWRAETGSTALNADEKTYTADAGLSALHQFLMTEYPGATAEKGILPNTYRVRWPLPQPRPLVSLLIPTRDRRSLTEVCVRSIIEKSTYKDFEIIILDNGSIEAETLEFFDTITKEDERVRVIRYDYPFNYSAINNFGVKHARGEIIGLVNNDIEVISEEWLDEMVGHVLRPSVGCVGAKLYYGNDTVQHGGVICCLGGVAGHSHKHYSRNSNGYFGRLAVTQELSAVTAACLLIRKSVYEEVGGLDEVNLPVAFNDVDLCLKTREAGYRNIWTPHAELYHHESVSRGAEDTPEKAERARKEILFMKDKWKHVLHRDPFYSVNLSQDREDFSLKQ